MDSPLIQELKHEAKPGFARIFEIVFATMCFYLAIIFVLSSGSPKKHPTSTAPDPSAASSPGASVSH